jgi:Fibronectin type III domain/Glyoxal oxidase N-terminus/Kelch motif
MNDTAPSVRYHMVAWEVLAATGPPPTSPGAPTGVTATPGNGSATVSWTAPNNGGSPIASYTVTPYIGNAAQTPTVISGSPPGTSTTITGLTNGTSYTFAVTATNAVGTGPPSSPSAAVTPTAPNGGQWSSLMSWPMVAIHSVLLKNGNVLQFDGWQQPEPTQVWNPSTQTFTTQTAADSIFCSGMAELPDGRVLVVGGYGGLSTGQQGIFDTSIFDPATTSWSRVANMHYPRWYPDLTELSDGRYVAISGNSTTSSTWADTPEVYDPVANTWTVLSNVNTSQVHEEEYPFSYLVPNGDVFTIGPSEDKSFLLNVPNQTWTQVGGFERRGERVLGDVPAGEDPVQRRHQHPEQLVPGERDDSGHRPDSADADVAADVADELPAGVPHPDHAGRWHRAGRRRRAYLGANRSERGLGWRAAERDLGPDKLDVVSRGVNWRHPWLPLDRDPDARRHSPRRR